VETKVNPVKTKSAVLFAILAALVTLNGCTRKYNVWDQKFTYPASIRKIVRTLEGDPPRVWRITNPKPFTAYPEFWEVGYKLGLAEDFKTLADAQAAVMLLPERLRAQAKIEQRYSGQTYAHAVEWVMETDSLVREYCPGEYCEKAMKWAREAKARVAYWDNDEKEQP
jgi:hypothetical protein